MVDFALQHLPLWLAGVLLVLLCMIGIEVGRFIHLKQASRTGESVETMSSEVSTYIIGAIFGLLAFMVGLTFSIAVNRFDDRRAWVAEEATAIETTFLRADFIGDPYRTRFLSTLREYARSRIAPEGVWTSDSRHQLELSHELRVKLWNDARAGASALGDSNNGASFSEAVTEMLNVGTRRELSGTFHIPSRIVNALILYLLVASAVLGYLAGSGPRRHHAAAARLFVLFAIAFVIILDLDRPRSGAIQVSQQPVQDLIAKLDRAPWPKQPPSKSE